VQRTASNRSTRLKHSSCLQQCERVENHSIYGDKSLDYVADVRRMNFNGGSLSSRPAQPPEREAFMTRVPRFSGVLVPVLTPFKPDLSPDTQKFVQYCRWMLDQGVDGLAVFGTIIDAGIPGEKLMPGTGACSLTEAARLTSHAVNHGCRAVLMLPPFYYKGVSDDGLFASFSEVIQRVGDSRLALYLYHIPPIAVVPITLSLIERLIKEYPDTVVGLKDSSGDWSNTESILNAFPGFGTFAGSEAFLLATLRGGGVGCITATGNVNPAGIKHVADNWQTPQADELQAGITLVRKTIQAYPLVPACKRIVAQFHDDVSWAKVRPPLDGLGAEQSSKLLADLEAVDFAMAPLKVEMAAQ
jgi:4-hydroxy-tetrahydrodipicolinate synthase